MSQSITGRLGKALVRLGGGDTSIALFIRGGAAGLTYLTHVVATNVAGAEAFGVYVLILSWVEVLRLCAGMGFPRANVYFTGKYRGSGDLTVLATYRKFSRIAVVLGSLILVVVASAALALEGERVRESVRAAAWIGILIIPIAAFLEVEAGRLRGHGRIAGGLVPARLLVPAVLVLCLLVFGWGMGSSISGEEILTYRLGGLCLALVGTIYIVRKYRTDLGVGRFAGHLKEKWREWLRKAVHTAVGGGGNILLSRTDTIVVGAILGPTQAGVYTVAASLASAVSMPVGAVNYSMAPKIAEAYGAEDGVEMARIYRSRVAGIIILVWLIGAGILSLREPLLKLYGEEYLAGSAVLVIVAVGKLLAASIGSVNELLNMTGHQEIVSRVTLLSAVVNGAANILGVYTMGLVGAGIATVLVLVGSNWVLAIVAKSVLGIRVSPSFKMLIRGLST